MILQLQCKECVFRLVIRMRGGSGLMLVDLPLPPFSVSVIDVRFSCCEDVVFVVWLCTGRKYKYRGNATK